MVQDGANSEQAQLSKESDVAQIGEEEDIEANDRPPTAKFKKTALHW